MTIDSVTLEHCPFFDRFQSKHLEKITHLASRVVFHKDQVIFEENDESARFYVILSGRVSLEAQTGERKLRKLRIQTLYAGDELGWSAMLGRQKQFQARALDSVEALSFDAVGLREACDTNPYFGRAFLERLLIVIAERLQSTRLELLAALATAEAQCIRQQPGVSPSPEPG